MNSKLIQSNTSRVKLVAAKRHIDTMKCGKLRIEQIADTACMSRLSFIRKFKSKFGVTPYQFQFKKQNSTSKQFKKFLGTSPSHYLAMARNDFNSQMCVVYQNLQLFENAA